MENQETLGGQSDQNIIKMTPQIDTKSMKHRGCFADGSLKRFGAPHAVKSRAHAVKLDGHLGTIFDKKMKKRFQPIPN